jgi:two-component system chemotaxis sensor kinase CheA
MIDQALLGEYLSESEQLLDALLADLDLLGSQGAENQKDKSRDSKPKGASDAHPDLVNRIFRTVHSLKGLSGMMGLRRVQSLTHEFENLLDDLRLGKVRLDRHLSSELKEAGERLAAIVGLAARGSASEEDFKSLKKLLISAGDRPRSSRNTKALGVRSLRLSDRERKLLAPYEEHRINENLKAGRAFYEVSVQFEISDLETGYRALTGRLGDIGEVITALPGPAEASNVGFKLVLASLLKEDDLKRIVEPFDARASRIGPSSWFRASAAIKSVRRKKESQQAGEIDAQAADGDDVGASSAVIQPNLPQESLQVLSPSVRVNLSQIDELSGLAHELSIETARLSSMAGNVLTLASSSARDRFDLKQSARRIERQFIEMEERLVELRMVSLAQTFTRAARLADRLACELGKSVTVELAGRATHLDKMIVDRIAGPIYHVLRNAIDHGIEPPEERRRAGKNVAGKLKIEASLEGTRAVIAISDDGRGIDTAEVLDRAVTIGALTGDEQLTREDALRLIFQPGFSTVGVGDVSTVSGRGVGLDAVERSMYELGGEIRVTSEKGKGSRFELAVPTTLVMISAFAVRVAEWRYAINVGQIVELAYVSPGAIIGSDGKRKINWRGSAIPLIELKYLLGLGGARRLHSREAVGMHTPINARPIKKNGNGGPPKGNQNRVAVFITRVADRPVAIAVERFEGQREIIVKSLGSMAPRIKGIVGAVDLEGGDVALVLDLPSLLMLRSVRL